MQGLDTKSEDKRDMRMICAQLACRNPFSNNSYCNIHCSPDADSLATAQGGAGGARPVSWLPSRKHLSAAATMTGAVYLTVMTMTYSAATHKHSDLLCWGN